MPSARPHRPPSLRKSIHGSSSSSTSLAGASLVALAGAVACGAYLAYPSAQPSTKPLPPRGPATALHFAAQRGELETARRLLQAGAIVDAATKLGATPLHVACEQGATELVRLLLAAGAAHDAQSDAGLSPLHFAAEQGKAAVAQLLLESGADADARTHTGHTPLHVAVQKAQLDVAGVLLSHGAFIEAATVLGHSPLHMSALVGESGALRLLLASGADADAPNALSGHTALHVAAQKNQQHIAQVLLAREGIAVDAKTLMGHTPLSIALDEGHFELARLLLSNGAAPTVNDSRGATPLHIAASRGAGGMVTELLRRGAAVDAATSFGLSPLDLAVYRAPTAGGAPMAGGALSTGGAPSVDPNILRLLDPLATLEALLDGGAEVLRAHPWTGQTPLHAAAYLGRDAWSELMMSKAKLAQHPRGDAAAVDDFRRHVQRGDGLEQRAQSTGRSAPSSAVAIARVRTAACDAFEAAIALAPANAMAHERLGNVQARLAHAYQADASQAGQERARLTFERAWRLLQPHRDISDAEGGSAAEMAAFARRKIEMALAGFAGLVGANDGGSARPARTVGDLSVSDLSAAGGSLSALRVWRQQGVVVFPALLGPAVVSRLRAHALSALQQHAESIDRTAHIRAPANRTLRAMAVTDGGAEALTLLASELDGFLTEALQSTRRLLLEFGVMSAAATAAEQGWHRDDGVLDGRVASVQIALVDTDAAQGALEVQPATHTHTEAPREEAEGVTVAVPAGSVTVYSPNVVHRGRANTRGETRLTAVLTLMGTSGLVPNGIPLAIQPEDAGRWWLEAGELRHGHGVDA